MPIVVPSHIFRARSTSSLCIRPHRTRKSANAMSRAGVGNDGGSLYWAAVVLAAGALATPADWTGGFAGAIGFAGATSATAAAGCTTLTGIFASTAEGFALPVGCATANEIA